MYKLAQPQVRFLVYLTSLRYINYPIENSRPGNPFKNNLGELMRANQLFYCKPTKSQLCQF